MAAAIQIQGLTKKYLQRGEVVAVDNLTLDVEEGEIFGFLGPNGAGKTTTIKMLLGLIFPTSGTASMLAIPSETLRFAARFPTCRKALISTTISRAASCWTSSAASLAWKTTPDAAVSTS
jgi:ABC-type branched-subunit amino acid transport system ATPase component